jgi:prolipoprotein diacylglyceryltransferase
MEQQTPHWITLAIALTIGLVILLCNLKPSKDRRSFGQWVILMLYKVIRFFWAIVRATDVGYLEYRRIVQGTSLETENEKCLGKIAIASPHKNGTVHDLNWDAAAN